MPTDPRIHKAYPPTQIRGSIRALDGCVTGAVPARGAAMMAMPCPTRRHLRHRELSAQPEWAGVLAVTAARRGWCPTPPGSSPPAVARCPWSGPPEPSSTDSGVSGTFPRVLEVKSEPLKEYGKKTSFPRRKKVSTRTDSSTLSPSSRALSVFLDRQSSCLKSFGDILNPNNRSNQSIWPIRASIPP